MSKLYLGDDLIASLEASDILYDSSTTVKSKIDTLNTNISGKAPTSHASSATTYGVGTTSNYGHCMTINDLTTSSHANGKALSAYQGYVLKNSINELNSNMISRPVNNNILINSNFANPVNQRGQSSITPTSGIVYWIDRWRAGTDTNGGLTYTVVDGGIQITGASDDKLGALGQHLEFPEMYLGKTVTMQSCVNGVVHSFTVTLPNTLQSFWATSDFYSDGTNLAVGISGQNSLYAQIGSIVSSVTFEWVKLEFGEVATPYVPRLYGEELQLCKRYYQIFKTTITAYTTISSSSLCILNYHFLTEMRAKPTVVKSQINNSANSNVGGSLSDISLSADGLSWIKYSSNLSAGKYYFFIWLDAEL